MAPDALYHQLNKPYEPRSTDHGLNPNELYELPEPNEPRPPGRSNRSRPSLADCQSPAAG